MRGFINNTPSKTVSMTGYCPLQIKQKQGMTI